MGSWSDGVWAQVEELDQNLHFLPLFLCLGEWLSKGPLEGKHRLKTGGSALLLSIYYGGRLTRKNDFQSVVLGSSYGVPIAWEGPSTSSSS